MYAGVHCVHIGNVLNSPGTEYPPQIDHFNAMEFYFQKMLTVAFFGMLFWRLRLRGICLKIEDQNMSLSRKGMEIELLLNECPGSYS